MVRLKVVFRPSSAGAENCSSIECACEHRHLRRREYERVLLPVAKKAWAVASKENLPIYMSECSRFDGASVPIACNAARTSSRGKLACVK